MRILFLYTELADYTIACLKALKTAEPNVKLLVVHFPINPEAPFRFDFENIGQFVCIKDYPDYSSFHNCVKRFRADKIVCSGWINKWYIRFCSNERKRSLCILSSDNVWNGSWKQQVLRIISRATFKRIFKKIWVPGPLQVEYAKKIGFREDEIITGYYSCDFPRFNAWFEKYKEVKKQEFPRRFLCVARYIPAKGYQFLWDAFIEWKSRSANDWELWCAGTGVQFDERKGHPAIRHLGFVQKDEWECVISSTGVFVLPSLYEPWGVVVHEFAASGYPLLISKHVGAASLFISGKNGFTFDPENKEQLIRSFDTISKMSGEELYLEGLESSRLSQQITPARWAHALLGA